MSRADIVSVALPSPLRRCFDYLPQRGGHEPCPGVRVRVPFGSRTRVGVVVAHPAASAVPAARLKRVESVLDADPLLDDQSLRLLEWASDYYQHPIGEVLFSALPAPLRRGQPAVLRGPRWAALTREGGALVLDTLARAPRQRAILAALAAQSRGMAVAELLDAVGGSRSALSAMVAKGWVAVGAAPAGHAPLHGARAQAGREREPALESAQRSAAEAVSAALGHFRVFLLEGVTGSGKTEVYLELAGRVAAAGGQTLVLVPEIGLTPQIVGRFRQRLGDSVSVLHSQLSDTERMRGWLMSREGRAPVVLGTRSAVLAPMRNPALLIIDEEHDPSFKQQDGFRYCARDLAVVRARMCGIPVLLGSATPSLESLFNAASGRYERLELPARVGGAALPRVHTIDLRRRPLDQGLSVTLREAIDEVLTRREQALLFLNRRGYAPTLLCHACGWVSGCERCDARLVLHRTAGRLRCHHCGHERPAPRSCPECAGEDLLPVGAGTERLEVALRAHFPRARIARVDRDSTRRRGAFDRLVGEASRGEIDILLGTQMLAKGHHFPRVTLVGVVDADAGLFGADFRCAERMAQLIVQVSGRAGRGEHPGRVLIQTHHPDHPLLAALIAHGYPRFAEQALAERVEAGLPPAGAMAILRAEAHGRGEAAAFLESARSVAGSASGPVQLLGPVPAPMERRAGRHRAQLMMESPSRGALQGFLRGWIPQVEALPSARRVRWSIDVDPYEIL